MTTIITEGENGGIAEADIPFKERQGFIGCFVRQSTKDVLKREGKALDRPLSWVVNRVLEGYVNAQTKDQDDNTTK